MPRYYIALWKDLDKWILPRHLLSTSDLPEGWTLVGIGDLVRQITDRVRVEMDKDYKMIGVKWYGEGTFHRETVKGSSLSANYVSPLVPDALIYNRLFAWKGSFAVVPDEHSDCFVSNEFPQFEVDKRRILPRYLYLFLMCDSTVKAVSRASIGSAAVSRNRFKEEYFLNFEMPLPPLPIQNAIVEQWDRTGKKVAAAKIRLTDKEKQIAPIIYEELGIKMTDTNNRHGRMMVVMWKDINRWSFNYIAREKQGLLGFTNSRFPIVPLVECIKDTMNGYCIKPVETPSPYKMLKLNAIDVSGLDLSKAKFINVPEEIAERFSIKKDDLLICRSVGSYDLVAKCAVVEEDHPNILFPDIVIRTRLKANVLAQYVREVIQTPIGRSHFLSNARTAVGMWKIGAEDIRSFPIPLPPIDIQKIIVNRIQSIRTTVIRERAVLEKRRLEIKSEIEAMILGTKEVGNV